MDKGKFWLRESEDGSINIGYEDLNVEMLGGDDYEVNYTLTPTEAQKLKEYLQSRHTGSLKEMITAEFNEYLDGFSAKCDELGIKNELFTWIG